jgi:cyclic pyranopterin phosphate synthase
MTASTPAASNSAISDRLGRPLRDLRISVTDRCNFRCVYCMPKEVFGPDHPFLARGELLSFEEITRIARVARDLGVTKIRLTGGEPLLRKNLERLVEMLARLDLDLTLTTNASILEKKARALRDAGLRRLTVSLDALDDATFKAMNDVDFPVSDVLRGIDAAAAVGLAPIKINMVVKRGLNDADVVAMARHFRGSGHIVRFIEFMDVGATNGWRMDDVVPSAEIIRRIDAELPLEPAAPLYRGEVASRWRYKDGSGEIGVISSVTEAFCRDCTRLRLSTEGMLYTCLFASSGHDLRSLLRPADGSAASDATMAGAIAALWRGRGDRYSELRTANTPEAVQAKADRQRIEMSYIGG